MTITSLFIEIFKKKLQICNQGKISNKMVYCTYKNSKKNFLAYSTYKQTNKRMETSYLVPHLTSTSDAVLTLRHEFVCFKRWCFTQICLVKPLRKRIATLPTGAAIFLTQQTKHKSGYSQLFKGRFSYNHAL